MKEEKIPLMKVIGGILSGIFLEISGVMMIFRDLEGYGDISVESSLLKANISATDIGLLVIFLGVVVQIFAIRTKIHKEKIVEKRKNGESIYVKESSKCDGGIARQDLKYLKWRKPPYF